MKMESSYKVDTIDVISGRYTDEFILQSPYEHNKTISRWYGESAAHYNRRLRRTIKHLRKRNLKIQRFIDKYAVDTTISM